MKNKILNKINIVYIISFILISLSLISIYFNIKKDINSKFDFLNGKELYCKNKKLQIIEIISNKNYKLEDNLIEDYYIGENYYISTDCQTN